MTDVEIKDVEHAMFGDGMFDCTIDHNEDGASLMFSLPCGIVPVAVATCTRNSESHLLFVALRDMPDVKIEAYDFECPDVDHDHDTVKAGKVYFVAVDHCEDHEPRTTREIVKLKTVYYRESHEDTEWMDGMIARQLMTGYDYKSEIYSQK